MEYKGYKIKAWGEWDGNFDDPIYKHPLMYYMETDPLGKLPAIMSNNKSIANLEKDMKEAIDKIVGEGL